MVDTIPERRRGDIAKGNEKSARNLLCRASFFSGCNHYSQRAYCTKESACYQKLSRLHVPIQACFLVPPGKSQKRRNGRNRKCFITADGKSLEYREYRLDVSPENQHLYRNIIIFQEDSLQYLSHDQQMAQDLDDGSLIAVSQNLLSTGDDKVKFHWCTAHHYLFPINLTICNIRPSSCAKCKEKRLQKQNVESGSSRKRKFGSRGTEASEKTLSPKRVNLIQDLTSSILFSSLNRTPELAGNSSLSLSEQLSLLLSAAQSAQPRIEPAPYAHVTADQLVSSINRVCSSSPTFFEPPTWVNEMNPATPSSAELVSMISQTCQLHIPTPRYPLGHFHSGLRAGM